MDERADEIEQDIHKTRANLSDNLDELEQKVRSTFDWRTQFQERPLTMLAVAFGGGVLASALLPSRRRRYLDRRKDSVREEVRAAQGEAPAAANGNTKQANESFDALKGAVIGVAASRLGGVIGDVLSGYREEVRKARRER
jgi:hypothetical protein